LYQKFALDNLAAVHSIKKRGGKLRKSIKEILQEFEQLRGCSELDARLDELANMALLR
jgi:hypothetical protein